MEERLAGGQLKEKARRRSVMVSFIITSWVCLGCKLNGKTYHNATSASQPPLPSHTSASSRLEKCYAIYWVDAKLFLTFGDDGC